jgi:hypothetical protein
MTAVTMNAITTTEITMNQNNVALAPSRLKAFDQIADAQRVGFAMTVTGDRIGAS